MLTPAASLAEIRLAIERCTGCALRLRGVEPLPFQLHASPASTDTATASDTNATICPSSTDATLNSATAAPPATTPDARQLMAVCAHLPPEAAALVESGGLETLLTSHGAIYYPGSNKNSEWKQVTDIYIYIIVRVYCLLVFFHRFWLSLE